MTDSRDVLALGKVFSDADLPIPERYKDLRSRLQTWEHRMGTEVPHLIATLLDTDAPLDNLGSLAARAAAEVAGGRPELSARLNRQVVTALSEALLYELVMAAPSIYAEAAKRFDKIAKEAVAAWVITPPNASAESFIGPEVTEEQRLAYHAGQAAGWKLEEAVVPLTEAARAHPGTEMLTVPFAGKPGGWVSRIASASAGISLVVKPPEDPKQQQTVLDTWRAPRDGRRWFELYQLGCRFGAIADPSRVTDFCPAPPPPVTAAPGAVGAPGGPNGDGVQENRSSSHISAADGDERGLRQLRCLVG